MPTTPAEAVLFLVLLTPGFCYLFRAELPFPSKYAKTSSFRETVTVLFVSAVTLVIAALPVELMRACGAQWTPDAQKLLANNRTYDLNHYLSLTLWSIAIVVAASCLAFWAAGAGLADWFRSLGADKSATFTSGWYATFELPEAGDRYKRLTCGLVSGTIYEGTLLTYNPAPDDDLERDLTLSGPLYSRRGATEVREEFGALILSAAQIAWIHVDYLNEQELETAVNRPVFPRGSTGSWRASKSQDCIDRSSGE